MIGFLRDCAKSWSSVYVALASLVVTMTMCAAGVATAERAWLNSTSQLFSSKPSIVLDAGIEGALPDQERAWLVKTASDLELSLAYSPWGESQVQTVCDKQQYFNLDADLPLADCALNSQPIILGSAALETGQIAAAAKTIFQMEASGRFGASDIQSGVTPVMLVVNRAVLDFGEGQYLVSGDRENLEELYAAVRGSTKTIAVQGVWSEPVSVSIFLRSAIQSSVIHVTLATLLLYLVLSNAVSITQQREKVLVEIGVSRGKVVLQHIASRLVLVAGGGTIGFLIFGATIFFDGAHSTHYSMVLPALSALSMAVFAGFVASLIAVGKSNAVRIQL